jgi:hypothetical protein
MWRGDDLFSNKGDDGVDELLHTLASTQYGSDHELTGAHAPQPNPNKRPLTDPDPEFDWDYWSKVKDPNPPGPAPPKRPKYDNQVEDVQQPNPGPDPGFDWEYWSNLDDPTPLKQASPKEIGLENQAGHVHVGWQQQPSPWPSPGSSADSDFEYIGSDDLPQLKPASQAHESQVEPHVQQPNPRPSTEPEPEVVDAPLPNLVGSPKNSNSELDDNEVVQGPSSSLDPELHQPSSPDSQMTEVQAAIYAAKGKAKQLRRVSGNARDVGNATQRELQPEPAERSLDPGE